MSEELRVHQQVLEVGYIVPDELQVHQQILEVGYRTGIQLTWTEHSIYVSSIKIERKTDEGEWTEVQSVNPGVCYWHDTTFEAGHTYQYRVRAYSTIRGYSVYSNVATFTV